jgi:hypothetical protein
MNAQECQNTETDFTPCLAHIGGALAGCRLAYCPECLQNLWRDCESISWGELAELTHATQVERFGFCMCEDNEGNENPFSDCPKGDE